MALKFGSLGSFKNQSTPGRNISRMVATYIASWNINVEPIIQCRKQNNQGYPLKSAYLDAIDECALKTGKVQKSINTPQ
jgi:hypothetical protein